MSLLVIYFSSCVLCTESLICNWKFRCCSDMKPPEVQRGQSLSRSLPDLMAEEKLIFSAFKEKGKSSHLYFIPNIAYRTSIRLGKLSVSKYLFPVFLVRPTNHNMSWQPYSGSGWHEAQKRRCTKILVLDQNLDPQHKLFCPEIVFVPNYALKLFEIFV